MSKILTVFGATGNQGGSVVKAVLAHSELSKTYKIRAITRDVSKPAAVALKEKGAEVVTADMNDKASLVKAVQGSSIVFGVTNFWETGDADKEFQQGKNLADACKEVGVERFIFSSLVYVSKATEGKNTRVKHFDSKARVEEYARSIGLAGSYYMPAVFMSFILSNFRPNDKGVYSWNAPIDPDSRVPFVDAAGDTGKFVGAILLNLDQTLGKRILGSGGYLTLNQVAAQFAEATGKKAQINKISWEVFKSVLSPAVAEELTANFELMESPGYYVGEPADAVDNSIELVSNTVGLGHPTTWMEFVKTHFNQ